MNLRELEELRERAKCELAGIFRAVAHAAPDLPVDEEASVDVFTAAGPTAEGMASLLDTAAKSLRDLVLVDEAISRARERRDDEEDWSREAAANVEIEDEEEENDVEAAE